MPVPGTEYVVLVPPPAFFVFLNPFTPQLNPIPDLLRFIFAPPPSLMLFLNRRPILIVLLISWLCIVGLANLIHISGGNDTSGQSNDGNPKNR